MSETNWVLEITDRTTGTSEIIAGPADRFDIERHMLRAPDYRTARRGLITVWRRFAAAGDSTIAFGPSAKLADGTKGRRYLASIGPATNQETTAA